VRKVSTLFIHVRGRAEIKKSNQVFTISSMRKERGGDKSAKATKKINTLLV